MKIYKHKKTGKYYSLVSDHFMVKNVIKEKRIYTPDSFEMEFETTYKWNPIKHIFYHAEYDCSDGPDFARLPEDFYNEFIPVTFKRKNTDDNYGWVDSFKYINDKEQGFMYYEIHERDYGGDVFNTLENFLNDYEEIKL